MKRHDRDSSEKVMEKVTSLYVIVVVLITEAKGLNRTLSQIRTETVKGILNNTYQLAHLPPGYETNIPLVLKIGLYINSFNAISDSNMDYEMTLNVKMSWFDERLKYTKIPNHDRLELEAEAIQQMWFPDIYFANAKDARFHYVTVPNTMVHIFPEGKVYTSIKVTTILRCDMDLRKFPFDTQICRIQMVSYAFSRSFIVLKWFKEDVEFRPNLRIPRFYLTDYSTSQCQGNDDGGIREEHSCLIAFLVLERAYGYFLTEIYIPSILVVILSWVTFWLDVEAVPARITLGLLTVLTMTTQGANSGSNLPRISSIKAIDVWVATCLFFVFGALMEFAYVNVKARLEDWFMFCGRVHYESLQDIIGSISSSDTYDEPHSQSKEHSLTADNVADKPGRKPTSGTAILARGSVVDPSKKTIIVEPEYLCSRQASETYSFDETMDRLMVVEDETALEKARHIDRISRIAFPSLFGVFNLLYWITYLSWDEKSTKTKF